MATASVAAYFVDPYLFGFATFGLAGATGVVALVGVAVFVRSAIPVWHRWIIAISLAVAVGAIAVALAVLRGIRWA